MKLENAIALSVANVKKEGLTDIFDEPRELIHLSRNALFEKKIAAEVKKRVSSNSLSGLRVHQLGHVLFPKKEVYDFRRAALMQPVDTLVFLALVLTVADDIEKRRIPKARKRVFSYRLKPQSGYLFDKKYNLTSFQSHVAGKTRSARTKVLIKCDIANFYDRLNLHRLESTLLSIDVDKKKVKLINELLLFWANRDSYSLPIGSNASRILAEAALISVDDYLISHKVNFCRFVDDYRIFAPNAKTAHIWLTLLVERLFLEGLTINPSKTVIEDVSSRTESTTEPEPREVRETLKEETPIRIIVGYTGTIPTKFRELSEREFEELRSLPFAELEERISSSQILKPEDVRKFLKLVVAHDEYEKLSVVEDLAEKFPQFTPLMIDLVIKKFEKIPEATRLNLVEYFSSRIVEAPSLPEYIQISIVRLLGSKGFENKDTLMKFFRNLKRNSGAYIGRATIDALEGLVSRTDVLEIRQYYPRADDWEKRAIINLVDQVLSDEEKRPWLKNVKIHSADDFFAIESFEPVKPKKKK